LGKWNCIESFGLIPEGKFQLRLFVAPDTELADTLSTMLENLFFFVNDAPDKCAGAFEHASFSG
jgi:hypothetical protein